jgi:hypothetical protein
MELLMELELLDVSASVLGYGSAGFMRPLEAELRLEEARKPFQAIIHIPTLDPKFHLLKNSRNELDGR